MDAGGQQGVLGENVTSQPVENQTNKNPSWNGLLLAALPDLCIIISIVHFAYMEYLILVLS